MSGWSRRGRQWAVVGSALAAAVALAGCSGSAGTHTDPGAVTHPSQAAHHSQQPPSKPVVPATLTSSVRSASTGVPVDTAVKVSAAHGKLTRVVFSTSGGAPLAGTYDASHTTWTASEFLDPATRYTIRSQAINADGKVARSFSSFTSKSLTLAQQTYPSVTPLQGQVVGIGMPVVVHFDVPVTNHAQFEKYMTVQSTPAQVGSWHWISDQEVHWRPRTYWQPGTKVHVHLALNGVNAGNGIYGQLDRDVHFTIGKGVLIRASVATDHMHVYVDGKLVRVIPITGGKPGGFQTRSGIKVISQKYLSIRMDSATVGIDPNGPDGYDIPDVQYAMRVTNSGEFLHAAPWSVYAQGHYNVSHGCIGMSTDNAHWLFDLAEIGTPVVVTGSSRPLEPQNGWTDWDLNWAQWKAGSALH